MATNKVIYDGQVLIDLSTDTLTSADQLLSGITGHLANGNKITGTLSAGPTLQIATTTATPASASTSFTISGLKGEPKLFFIALASNITTSTTRYVVNASYDGSTRRVTYSYKSGNNGYVYQSSSYLTYTYNNGTLTLKTSSSTNGGNFYRAAYNITYLY